MSTVEVVRVVDAHTTVYRWEASGLEELHRRNKLSSLPFWFPNSTTRQHQFQLVLLRGLVQSASPDTDPFGVLLELIPPPPPPDTADTTACSGDYPGGCAATCEVLLIHDNPKAHPQQQQQQKPLVSTKTCVLDRNTTQVSFPELMPADLLHNARYVGGTPKSCTLQLTLQTGISVPLHHAATTAFSFFSSITSSVGQLLGNTAQLYHDGRESVNAVMHSTAAVSAFAGAADAWHGTPTATGGSAASAPASASASAPPALLLLPPWEPLPEEWRDRGDAWRTLVSERLARLDGAYRHGPERVLAADEVALLGEVGLVDTDLWALYDAFDAARDVHEGLLLAAEVRARRYRLVPARLTETTFWNNYMWKVHCLGLCVTARQVSAVLVTLCTPARADLLDAATLLSEAVLRHVLDAADAAAVVVELVERGEATQPWCAVAVETARHCRAVLQAVVAQPDLRPRPREQVADALADVEAALSCYSDALEEPIGDVGAWADTTAAATPPPPAPAAAPDTAERDASPPPPPEPSEAAEAALHDTPTATATPTAAADATTVHVAAPPPPAVEQVAFAKMPWEEEDEDAL
ncbi:BSD domain containing protein [Novymonas esmeraldas]|uniref:BSD domain containing protein n=1 Tax=Novymonas esmeraldas TaxID=1808958 RepID=A0AAW0ENT8_9TRYP